MIALRDSAEFEQLINVLSHDVVDAHIHFRMYEELVDAIERHPVVVQQSNTFWTFTLQSHLNSSLFALFRAYDQDTRALHLCSWLVAIQENLHFFDEEAFRDRLKDNPYVASLAKDSRKPDAATLSDDIAACSSSDPLVKKLTVYRSNRIAHRNAKALLSVDDIGERFGLTFDDVRALLERARTIINRYSYLFTASTYSTKVIGHDDFEYIFKCVEEKVEEARRQWASQT
jgi:AbiU2